MTSWPHAPSHIFHQKGSYIVTGATYNKELLFQQASELDLLHDLLLQLALQYNWLLEAWALFPNHYHFIAQSPQNPETLKKFISHFHSASARVLNGLHNTPGRQVWYQYWDTRISFHASYLARLNYVIQNPVKHKVVERASDYRWCSAHWFEQNASPAYFKTVSNFKTDSVTILDDF